MLPLNVHNVAGVLKNTNRTGLALHLGIPESIEDPLSAAAWWVREGRDRRWRMITYLLDWIGETGLADELMPYSEPPSGV